MAIRERISELLDLPIRAGRWMTYCEALNREGRPDRITLTRMTMVICEELEALEANYGRLLLRFEQLEQPVAAPEKIVSDSPIDPTTHNDVITIDSNTTFLCPDCGRGFKAKAAVMSHRRTHNHGAIA